MTKMREQAAEKKTYPPIYGHSVQYAKEHGELEAFNKSYSLNDRCKWAIQDAAEGNIDGGHPKGDIIRTLTEEHGAERVGMILAGTVRYAWWDAENYSEDNKSWAKDYAIPADIGWKMQDGYMTVNVPAFMLDDYIESFRQEILGQEKKTPERSGPGRAAETKPKTVEKASLLARLKENAPKPGQAAERAQEKDRGRQRGNAR